MCGRYTLKADGRSIAKLLDLPGDFELEPRYNIAPTQQIPVVLKDGVEESRRLEMMHWGLVPSWAKDPSIGSRMINARSETIAEKPSFRGPFRKRRALIPADGYYEWQKQNSGPKQPYYFTVECAEPFAFAGIWESWRGSGGETVQSCAIITTAPNDLAAEVHDRMPVILPEEGYERWLDPDAGTEELLSLLGSYPAAKMDARPVSLYVNRPTNDDERCLEEI